MESKTANRILEAKFSVKWPIVTEYLSGPLFLRTLDGLFKPRIISDDCMRLPSYACGIPKLGTIC
ncbi:hypothetical protein AAE478_004004 [Parahypoxylon ruwenzoriense]